MKNGVKNIQAAAYNGARTVPYVACIYFTAVYNQERLMLQKIYALNKEIHQ